MAKYGDSYSFARRRLLAWYHREKREYPWRQSHHDSPYPVWTSEVMLQQTVLKAVLPAYRRFMAAFPDVESFASAEEAAVREAVRGLGYYRRFDLMRKAAQRIVREGRWPKSFHEWKALPGVGDYTASALASIISDEPVAVCDGNVERIAARVLNIKQPAASPALKKDARAWATRFLDPNLRTRRFHAGDFNQALMELGQTLCRPGVPLCKQRRCPLDSICHAFQIGSPESVPLPKIRRSTEDIRMRLHVLVYSRYAGILERPVRARFLRGYRGFLTEIKGARSFKPDGHRLTLKHGISVGKVQHGITHHRIDAEVILHRLKERNHDLTWIPLENLERALVTNLDRKAWRLVEKYLWDAALP